MVIGRYTGAVRRGKNTVDNWKLGGSSGQPVSAGSLFIHIDDCHFSTAGGKITGKSRCQRGFACSSLGIKHDDSAKFCAALNTSHV